MNFDFVSMNLVTLLYLVASVCFIQALKGLSHPTTSIRGNVFGMTGMTIAVLTTAALIVKLSGSGVGMSWVLLGLVAGGGAGTLMAQRVEMTKMPELVALMHSLVGLAAALVFNELFFPNVSQLAATLATWSVSFRCVLSSTSDPEFSVDVEERPFGGVFHFRYRASC